MKKHISVMSLVGLTLLFAGCNSSPNDSVPDNSGNYQTQPIYPVQPPQIRQGNNQAAANFSVGEAVWYNGQAAIVSERHCPTGSEAGINPPGCTYWYYKVNDVNGNELSNSVQESSLTKRE